MAGQLAEKININPSDIKVLIPMKGWSEADHEDGPLYDPQLRDVFIKGLKQALNPRIEVREADLHINDPAFAQLAAAVMADMLRKKGDEKA